MNDVKINWDICPNHIYVCACVSVSLKNVNSAMLRSTEWYWLCCMHRNTDWETAIKMMILLMLSDTFNVHIVDKMSITLNQFQTKILHKNWTTLGNKIENKKKTNHCLTHRGRVTHIYIGKVTIIGSDNGLLSGQRQAIIWTSARILLIGPLGTNFPEQSSWGQHGAHLGPVGPRWAPCRPHESCYQG